MRRAQSAAKPKFVGVRIDVETKSGTDVKFGPYRYTEDPDFGMLLIGYCPIREYPGGARSLGKARLLDLTDAGAVAQFQGILDNPRYEKHAFNANFERITLGRWMGLAPGTYLDPISWRCSAIKANTAGVFGTLDEVGRAVRSPTSKDKRGKQLIRFFSVPMNSREQKTADASCGCQRFHDPAKHPVEFREYGEYNKQDVVAEAMVDRLLPDPSDDVWREYEADQRINDRGFRHFKGLSQQAVKQVKVEKDRLMADLKVLTGLDNPNSIQQMQGWLDAQGYPMTSLDKAHREEALLDPNCPPHVQQVLTMKGAASLSSVAKHQAALDTRCQDGRIRGSLRFYGAHTGREAGRGIQPQNLPRAEASAQDRARLLRGQAGRDAPEIAKGTARASIVPARGHVFVVFDYNSIEARVLAGLAGEKWAEDEFKGDGKIYEATAATMFPGVVKADLVAALKRCGKCGHCASCRIRGSGKVSCIAEGEPVLTDHGLVPIERVSKNDLVWDGVEWVRHDGVVCLGIKEVITYDGLTATPDHRVWTTAGDGTPVALGDAAASGARLVQSGAGRNPVTVSGRYRDRAQVHQAEAPRSLRSGSLRRMLSGILVRVVERTSRESLVRLVRWAGPETSEVVGPQANSSEATLHESERSGVLKLRREGDRVPVLVGTGGGALDASESAECGARVADRPGGQRWPLRTGESPYGQAAGEPEQSSLHEPERVRPGLLAVRRIYRATATLLWAVSGRRDRQSATSRGGEAQGVAADRITTRVYDLLNAGPRHRFTVSGRLVHNCLALGYAGGAGALVTMGAEKEGIDIGNYKMLHAEWTALGKPGKFHEWERDRHDYPELIRLRDAYREASPMTVRFWKLCAKAWDVAALQGKGAKFGQDQMLTFIRDGRHNRLVLPSGRSIWYRFAKSHVETLKSGDTRVDRRTFIGKAGGVGHMRVDTHGGKLTENVVQAVARDILFDLIMRIESLTAQGWPGRIVLHVHDEVVIEVPKAQAQQVFDDVDGMMQIAPAWGQRFIVKGEGSILERYKK